MPQIELWTRYLPAALRARFQGRPNLRRIVTNVGWLFADRIVRLGVGLLVSIVVTRYLGPEQFGLLNYSIAFVGLLLPIAIFGLDHVLIRELVREPARADETMGSVFAIKVISGSSAFVVAIVAAAMIEAEDSLAQLLTVVAGITLLFQAFDVIDFWFQSQVRAKYAAWARTVSFLAVSAIRLILVLAGAPLLAFAVAFALESALAALGLVAVYKLRGQRLAAWRFTRTTAGHLFHIGLPLTLSAAAWAITVRIDQVMLGKMLGDAEVGVYAAAVRISELWYMIPMVIVNSVAPALTIARKTDPLVYRRRTQQLLNLMAGLAYLIAIPTTLLAAPLVYLLYGSEFAEAGPVLAVHIWGALFVNLGAAHNVWLLNEGLTRYPMLSTSVGAVVNVVVNLLLIPSYGAFGAAIATVISYAVTYCVMCFFFPPTRPLGRMIVKALVLRS